MAVITRKGLLKIHGYFYTNDTNTRATTLLFVASIIQWDTQ